MWKQLPKPHRVKKYNMPTRGQAISFRSNINSVIALMFVGSFALMCGLLVWHNVFNTDPVEKLFLSAITTDNDLY